MSSFAREICLSSIHVYWSSADSVFIALSDDHPDLVCRNPWSSLAAVDGLLDLIENRHRHHQPADRPAA
ncbi:hypothetical protein [Nocardia lijiangensis]|uniref:hypothetical protein n=1 Tax=Nocardia lijiangensis TaxID=299618 RepID=UPI0012DF6E3F|nr:hypothetical protein [Nocardia lijiangensis]